MILGKVVVVVTFAEVEEPEETPQEPTDPEHQKPSLPHQVGTHLRNKRYKSYYEAAPAVVLTQRLKTNLKSTNITSLYRKESEPK